MIWFLSVLLAISNYGGTAGVFAEAFLATSSMRISFAGNQQIAFHQHPTNYETIIDRCIRTAHAIDRNAFGVSSSTALEMISISPLSQIVKPDEVLDAPLFRDIDMLSDILSDIVDRDNPIAHDLYERFRKHGQNRAANPSDPEPLKKMIQCAKDISPENALGVMRTFALALNLINAAEVHHRVRNLRRSELEAAFDTQDDVDNESLGPLPMVEDSVRGTFDKIIKQKQTEGMPISEAKSAIYDALLEQKVEVILTAHPTEVNRRTVLRKCKYLRKPSYHQLFFMNSLTVYVFFRPTNH